MQPEAGGAAEEPASKEPVELAQARGLYLCISSSKCNYLHHMGVGWVDEILPRFPYVETFGSHKNP